MERGEGFGMPSPKRARVEAQTTERPATPIDDLDDLYDTPKKVTTSHSSVRMSSPPVLEHSEAIPKYAQLPGLSVVYDEPKLTPEDEQADVHTSGTLLPPQTIPSAEKFSGHTEARQEYKPYYSDEPKSTVDPEEILDRPAPTYEKAQNTYGAALRMQDDSSENVPQRDHTALHCAPAQSDEANLYSRLRQANIGSQSPGKGATFQPALDTELTHTESLGAGESHKEVMQESETARYDEKNEESSAMEPNGVIDSTEALAHTEPGFVGAAEANKAKGDAEFEYDSSPLGSSSSDTSSDTSSSDDSDADSDADDYKLLSPEEEARRLMADDGGSDDGRTGKGSNSNSCVVRTTNEKPDEVVPKPNIAVTADMRIEELGYVDNLVENIAVIKANTSGEYEVLETGSVLCLEDRSVIGVVAETLGRVQQPYYSVRFTNAAAMDEASISKGTKVFYVVDHSTTVFTQPLKAFKGTDASNLHDEEIGDDELEFSDDEAEAEHKRRVKLQKRPRNGVKDRAMDVHFRGPQNRDGGLHQRFGHGSSFKGENKPSFAETPLYYDDADVPKAEDGDEDGLYTPLARPANLHEMMERKPPSTENHTSRGNIKRGGRGGGRGERQRHRGNHGRDGGGKFDPREPGNSRGGGRPRGRQQSPPMPQRNGFSLPPRNNLPPCPPDQSNNYGPYSNQGNGYQPHLSQMPPPNYPPQAIPSSYSTFPSQYANDYTQSYSQPQRNQIYPSQYPQPPPNSQFYQPQNLSAQSYQSQQPFPPYPQYPAQQAAFTPPSPTNIPPGAHVNPAFFQQQAQPQPQTWQQPVSDATHRVKENLDVLMGFGGGGHGP